MMEYSAVFVPSPLSFQSASGSTSVVLKLFHWKYRPNVAFCGTVTVNYDRAKKYRTVIEDNAFIGCNTNLIAPVRVGEGAYIAAGSTITDDIPAMALSIARARQQNKKDWASRHKLKEK